MLQDRTHKLAVVGWIVLAAFLCAGLGQAANSSDDGNVTIDLPEGPALAANATSPLPEMEANDQENATESAAETDSETATSMEAVTPPEEVSVEASDVATANGANATIPETIPETVPETVPEIVPEMVGVEVGEALTATHEVCLNGCTFTTIQAAVDAAVDGDLVEVGSGTYNENIIVDKRITLRGVDTGEGVAVVNAQGTGSGIVLQSGGALLERLYVTNAGSYPSAGIEVVSSDNVIAGCSIWNSGWWGIYLKGGSSNNTVTETIISNSVNDGIMVYRAPGNRFIENTVANNGDNGIQILESENSVVERSIIGNNTNSGISVEASGNAVVRGNVISYNNLGIHLSASAIDRVGPNRFIGNGQEMAVA